MKRFLKFHHGEKGFTLIELLIVVAVLGILAAVLVPNLGTFLGTANVAAANTEAATVETAALAFYADTGGWPPNGDALYSVNATYLSDQPKGDYTIGSLNHGRISSALPRDWGTEIVWDSPNHKWIKAQ